MGGGDFYTERLIHGGADFRNFTVIKVDVGVINRSRRLRLITLTEALIILDTTKTQFNNCFIIHGTKKKMVTTASGTGNLFLNDGKQHKPRDLDMITLRNHAARS